jgi:GrpB-like predicted nucleotidyltransferase (UPF0157 family)
VLAARTSRHALGVHALDVEHIGSTAVPGLGSKPIVDIMVAVPALDLEAPNIAIATLGYESLGEAGVSGRRYFRKRAPQSFNVHFALLDGALWRANLALRDYLRSHPAAARVYEAQKRAAARRAPTLLAYSALKATVIAKLLARASATS